MLRFDDNHHAQGLQSFVKSVGDFRSQTLLYLKASREDFGEAREFREADYPPALRDVCDVAFADERREMVLAD